jgi:hypothetical protein
VPTAGVTVTVGVNNGTVTATADVAVPEALLYFDELLESGVYAALKLSEPTASDPAATVIVVEPATSVVEADV